MTILAGLGCWLAVATIVGVVLGRVFAYRADQYPPVKPRAGRLSCEEDNGRLQTEGG